MKARFSKHAIVDLERILERIKDQNPSAARRVSTHIKKAIGRIENFPYSCRATKQVGVRVLPLVRYPYLIFYRVDDVAQEIQILRVRHDARKALRHLT